jgi:putative flavoprotein involved in K+ transport
VRQRVQPDAQVRLRLGEVAAGVLEDCPHEGEAREPEDRAARPDQGERPRRDEVVDYLTEYAEHFDLPVELGSRVRSVVEVAGGGYRVELEGRAYVAEQVVVATGSFQVPFVPAIGGQLDPRVRQMHSTAYRSPRDVPYGTVLVVGGGNTGFQIAEELSESHEVHLSIGSRQMPLPQRILGRDLFWYLEGTGLIRKSVETRIGRRMAGRDTLIGSTPRRIRKYGVRLHGRAIEVVDGTAVAFADGERLEPGAVIWATGFRPDQSWIAAPVFGEDGRVAHKRGVTAAPGLYFVGLSWQHTRGSALLGWVGDDAEFIARQIDTFRPHGRPQAGERATSTAGDQP